MTEVTVTVAKGDVGGWVGDVTVHPDLLEAVVPALEARAETGGLLLDFIVTHTGDDIALILSHRRGAASADVRAVAHEALNAAGHRALELELHGPKPRAEGAVTFAEMTFSERASEPFVVFLLDNAGAGALNLPLYRSYADPFSTPSLVEGALGGGFRFDVLDLAERRRAGFACPEDTYRLLKLLAWSDRFAVRGIATRGGDPAVACSASADPAAICRSHGDFPEVGELLEPWATPFLVDGSWQDARVAPILPVGLNGTHATRTGGPPRAVALGFTLAGGELVGPLDLFDDVAFERARHRALETADVLRRQGPFAPRRTGTAPQTTPDAPWQPL